MTELQFCNFRLISNILATAIFSTNSASFTAYSFTRENARSFGAIRAQQRFEQCLRFLETAMRSALEALNVENFYDESVKKSATKLVELAVNDAIEDINKNKMLPDETKNMITRKLNSTKLWVMFPDDILNLTKIEEMYSELDFDSSERLNISGSFIELTWSILKHHRKLNLKPQNNWIKMLQTVLTTNEPNYFPDINVLSECE